VPDLADDAFNEGIPTTNNEIVFTPVIAKIVALCGLPAYSTMVKFIEQQEWSELGHVTYIGVNEVKDFHTVRNDGNYEAKPMMFHLRMFKAFLMFYTRKFMNCPRLWMNMMSWTSRTPSSKNTLGPLITMMIWQCLERHRNRTCYHEGTTQLQPQRMIRPL
jgi:hypothetical protein